MTTLSSQIIGSYSSLNFSCWIVKRNTDSNTCKKKIDNTWHKHQNRNTSFTDLLDRDIRLMTAISSHHFGLTHIFFFSNIHLCILTNIFSLKITFSPSITQTINANEKKREFLWRFPLLSVFLIGLPRKPRDIKLTSGQLRKRKIE